MNKELINQLRSFDKIVSITYQPRIESIGIRDHLIVEYMFNDLDIVFNTIIIL